MVAAVPLRRDVELFNEVMETPSHEVARLTRLAFMLRSEVKKGPANPVLRAALASALFHTGLREEGNRHLQSALGLCPMGDAVLCTELACQLMNIGEYPQAIEMLERLIAAGVTVPSTFPDVLLGALLSGDLRMLPRLQENPGLDALANAAPTAVKALKIIGEAGLLGHLMGHQAIVNDILRGRQCYAGIKVLKNPEGLSDDPLVFTDHFVVGDYALLEALTHQIFTGLCDYYESKGMNPGCWIGVCQPILQPIEAS